MAISRGRRTVCSRVHDRHEGALAARGPPVCKPLPLAVPFFAVDAAKRTSLNVPFSDSCAAFVRTNQQFILSVMRPSGLVRHLIELKGTVQMKQGRMPPARSKTRVPHLASIPVACDICRERPLSMRVVAF